MGRVSTVAAMVLAFGIHTNARADTFVVPLAVTGHYPYGPEEVPFEFDLGIALSEVLEVRFGAVGLIMAGEGLYTGCLVEQHFEAYLDAEAGIWVAATPSLGAATWPWPAPFAGEFEFGPSGGATWDFLLDGHATGQVSLEEVLFGPMFEQPPWGELESASLIIEAAPIPEPATLSLLALSGLFITRRWR